MEKPWYRAKNRFFKLYKKKNKLQFVIEFARGSLMSVFFFSVCITIYGILCNLPNIGYIFQIFFGFLFLFDILSSVTLIFKKDFKTFFFYLFRKGTRWFFITYIVSPYVVPFVFSGLVFLLPISQTALFQPSFLFIKNFFFNKIPITKEIFLEKKYLQWPLFGILFRPMSDIKLSYFDLSKQASVISNPFFDKGDITLFSIIIDYLFTINNQIENLYFNSLYTIKRFIPILNIIDYRDKYIFNVDYRKSEENPAIYIEKIRTKGPFFSTISSNNKNKPKASIITVFPDVISVRLPLSFNRTAVPDLSFTQQNNFDSSITELLPQEFKEAMKGDSNSIKAIHNSFNSIGSDQTFSNFRQDDNNNNKKEILIKKKLILQKKPNTTSSETVLLNNPIFISLSDSGRQLLHDIGLQRHQQTINYGSTSYFNSLRRNFPNSQSQLLRINNKVFSKKEIKMPFKIKGETANVKEFISPSSFVRCDADYKAISIVNSTLKKDMKQLEIEYKKKLQVLLSGKHGKFLQERIMDFPPELLQPEAVLQSTTDPRFVLNMEQLKKLSFARGFSDTHLPIIDQIDHIFRDSNTRTRFLNDI